MALPVRADDWPLARGDQRGSGVAKTAVSDTLDVLWTYKASSDAGFDATAVVADGIIYVGDTEGTFHAVQLKDGTPLWTKQFEDASFGAAAAVDVEAGRIYVGDLNGIVRVLAIADGEELWKAELDAEVYAGPTFLDGRVLVTSESGTLTAFDAASGEQQWQFSIDAPLRCSPTVAAGRVMLAGCDSKLHFIDATTGEETGAIEIDGPTGCTAAVHEERAYFGTEGGTFFAIDVGGQQDSEPAVAWTYRDPRRGQPIRAAAAVNDRVVVYGAQGKAIYGLDPARGEEKWKLPTRSRVESSPVIAGERVIAATTSGILYLLDAASGREIVKHEVGGNFGASPVVVDGKIILGNGDGTLYCFGAEASQRNNLATENIEVTE